MNLLALDTSTQRAALALLIDGQIARVSRPGPAARHGRALLPAIKTLLEDAGLSPKSLDGLAVGLGPGSYTGLRVGITAAKGLAYALGKPLAGFDSLEAVARNAPESARYVSVISDAQRGDVYAADFARDAPDAPLLRLTPTQIIPLDRWVASLPPDAFLLGPALTVPRLAPLIPPNFARPDDPDSHWPDPARLASLADEIWRSGQRVDPFFVEPLYLRRSAAEDQWEKLGR